MHLLFPLEISKSYLKHYVQDHFHYVKDHTKLEHNQTKTCQETSFPMFGATVTKTGIAL